MHVIVELFNEGVDQLFKRGWGHFVGGFLLIWLAVFCIAELVSTFFPPMKHQFEELEKQVSYLPAIIVSFGSAFTAGTILAALMKARLPAHLRVRCDEHLKQHLDEQLKAKLDEHVRNYLAANPPLKPLWQAKLRSLSWLHKTIQEYKLNLRTALHRKHSSTEDPVATFKEDVVWAFNSFSQETVYSRDIACGGNQSDPEDEECLKILESMERLQEQGQKLIAIRPADTIDGSIEIAIHAVDDTLTAISKVASDCRSQMRKKGIPPD